MLRAGRRARQFDLGCAGGGPLTTLALPAGEPSLWRLVWANTPRRTEPLPADLSRVFPLARADPYRRSLSSNDAGRDASVASVLGHAAPDQARLCRQHRTPALRPHGRCRCGDRHRMAAEAERRQYAAWEHPLSPASKDAKTGAWLPVHGQPGGIGYRHWVAIVLGDQAGSRRPARCIDDWRTRSGDIAPGQQRPRLLAAGYHMDKMKARAFVESEMPLPGTGRQAGETLAAVARRLVDAAGIAAAALRAAVRQARFNRDTSTDSTQLAAVYESFWSATQDRFFALLPGTAAGGWEAALDARAAPWRTFLKSTALRLFDEAAPLDPSAASCDPRRIVEARRNLFGTLDGRGPMGGRLFEALQLASPEPKAKRRQRAAAVEPT